jgi:hypothetical protein
VHKKAEITNVWSLLMITIVISIFIYMIINVPSYLSSPNKNLSASSNDYVNNLNGIDSATYTDSGDTNLLNENNESISEKWAFALPFLRLNQRIDKIKSTIYNIYNFPSFLMFDVLLITETPVWSWFVNLISWIIILAIFIGILYLIWK